MAGPLLRSVAAGTVLLVGFRMAGQETSSQATLAFQGYYQGGNAQRVSDISGLSFEFHHFIPKTGLLSGSLSPYAGESRFRTADLYLELAGVPWDGSRWTFRGGDFVVPLNLVEFPFTNIYYPQLAARGFQIRASTTGREYGFFAGGETLLSGPRVPFRTRVPQTAWGAFVKQRFGSRLEVGARFLRLTSSSESIRNNPVFFQAGRSFQAIDIAAVQSALSVTSHLKLLAEASSSFGASQIVPAGGGSVPVSVVAGPIYDTGRFTFRANYVSQSLSYLPIAGYFVGDRRGPFAEARLRPFDWLELFGSANRYTNNLEKAANTASFRSTATTRGASVRLPARFTASGDLSAIRFSSWQPANRGRQDSSNRQLSLNLTRPVGRHSLRLTGREIQLLSGGQRQRQRTGEVEDTVVYRRVVLGAAIRLQRQLGVEPKTTVSGRGSFQVLFGRFNMHGYFEAGNDLTNRTLFATSATTSAVLGLSARLRRTWSLEIEGYRNHLLTQLNPENIFVLQNQNALTANVLSTFNQWSFYFRMSKQFNWGQPRPSGNIRDYAASQVPLTGVVEGFVWAQSAGGRTPAPGVAVMLDGNRTVATGSDGQYRFSDVTDGPHKVALAIGELPVDYDPGTVRELNTLVQPKRTARADLEVVRLTGIEGQINGPKDPPLDRILIRLLPTERYTTPDPEGNFFFQNLREGDYVVALEKESLPEFGVMLSPALVPAVVRVGKDLAPFRFEFEIRMPVKPIRKVYETKAELISSDVLSGRPPMVADPPDWPTGGAVPVEAAVFRNGAGADRSAPRPAVVPAAEEMLAVQVGAFQSCSAAERMEQSLRGRYAVHRIVRREGSPFPWRLLIGQEPTATAAGALAEQIRKEWGEAFVVRLAGPGQKGVSATEGQRPPTAPEAPAGTISGAGCSPPAGGQSGAR